MDAPDLPTLSIPSAKQPPCCRSCPTLPLASFLLEAQVLGQQPPAGLLNKSVMLVFPLFVTLILVMVTRFNSLHKPMNYECQGKLFL